MFIASTTNASAYTIYRSSNNTRFKYNTSRNIDTVTSFKINTSNFQVKINNSINSVTKNTNNVLITNWSKVRIGGNTSSNGYTIPKHNVVQPSTPINDTEVEQATPIVKEPTKPAPVINEPSKSAPVVKEPQEATNTPTVEQEKPEVTQNARHSLTSSELQLIEYVNQARIDAGLNTLKIDVDLSYVARVKSEDMYENNYFSHTSPTYGSPFDMMKSFGIKYTRAAENLAKTSSVQSAHNGLMNSEGHRKNILAPGFTHIGVGIKNGYYTQMFITK
ncbi:MAG: sporulation protein [Alkaliphilus sp.]|nr:MAG: sporulation protein [Alkaliphilus sp.]